MKEKISNLKHWFAPVLFMALIFWLSSRPVPEFTRHIPIIFRLKLVHIVEYFILFILFYNALEKTTTYSFIEISLLAFTLTVTYGVTDEFHQIFVPGRSARLVDIFANSVGAFAGYLAVRSIYKRG